jgi:O-antigen ligase
MHRAYHPDRRPERVRAPSPIAPIALAAGAFLQVSWLGANDALLSVAASALNIVVAMLAVLMLAPAAMLWARMAPVLALLAAALLWTLLPNFGLVAAPRYAPDLAGPEITRFAGVVGVLIAGGVIGFRRGLMRTAVDWLLVFGAANLVLGLVLRQIDPEHVWGMGKGILAGRYTGTLLNANASGCIFGMLAVIGLGRLQGQIAALASPMRGRHAGIFAGLTALLVISALGACIITGSRTSVALTVCAMAAMLVLSLSSIRRIGSLRPLLLGLLLLLAGLPLLLLWSGDTFLNRIPYLEADAEGRVAIWRHYWDLAAASPWFGYGPGAFVDVNLHHLGSPHEALDFWYINAAHNAPIQLALEGGLPYLALIALALLAAALPIASERWGRRGDPLVRGLVLALLLVLGCSMTDIALNVPAVATLASAILGLLWGRGLRAWGAGRSASASPDAAAPPAGSFARI